jgi:hypothetical protein
VGGELAADDVAAFEDGDLMAERPEPDRRCQPADAAADDHDALRITPGVRPQA